MPQLAKSSRARLAGRVGIVVALALILAPALALPGLPPPAAWDSPTVLYVAAAAPPGGDGSSWARAYPYLQDALDRANGDPGTRYQVWIAAGTYYPDQDADGGHRRGSRTESFRIRRDGVQLYGGFDPAAGARTWPDRDPAAHPTILSGDVGRDDGEPAGQWPAVRGGNAYHVVVLDGTRGHPIGRATVLDGLTVRAGQANGRGARSRGGGLYLDGSRGGSCSPRLSRLVVAGNLARDGAGIYANGEHGGRASPEMANVVLRSNRATRNGGGLYADGSGGGVSSPLLANGVLAENEAIQGGAVYHDARGGGSNRASLTNVTMSGNRAEQGAALYHAGSGGECRPRLTNAILWCNGAAPIHDESASPVVRACLIRGGYPDGTDILDADPLFASAPGDLRLGAGSPALDAADAAALPADVWDLDGDGDLAEPLPLDLDGRPRIAGGAPDLGAYEAAGTGTARIYVDTSAAGANDGTSWPDAYVHLQDAFDQVNAGARSSYEVWVAAGVYYPDLDSDGDHVAGRRGESFTLARNGVRLYGGFDPAAGAAEWSERDPEAHRTILSGDVGRDDANADGNHVAETWEDIAGDNAFHVLFLDGRKDHEIGRETVLDGLTVTAGQANGSGREGSGGGIYCLGAGTFELGGADAGTCSPSLARLVVSGNQAVDYGGGLYSNGDQGGVTEYALAGALVTGNQAEDGGGIGNTSYDGTVSPALTRVTLRGNHATGEGGGMFNLGMQGGQANPILTGVVFEENVAERRGGGLYNHGYIGGDASPLLKDVTFRANRAASSGGGMANYGRMSDIRPVLAGVTFEDNEASAGGGMDNFVGAGGRCEPVILNARFLGNRAANGGGMFNSGNEGTTAPLLANVVFAGNQAESNGGGMHNTAQMGQCKPLIVNATFAGNQAGGLGGAIYNLFGAEPNLGLFNSILWGNAAASGSPQIHVEGPAPVVNTCLVEGGFAGGIGILDANPLFLRPPGPGPDGAWGTADDDRGDLHLDAGSPALDAGDAAHLPADSQDLDGDGDLAEPLPLDLDGLPRTAGAGLDLGAYERPEP